jgi:type VI secretion system protein ImpM
MFKIFSRKELPEKADIIGCFGKLPTHNEFIKYNLFLPELINIEQWYQNGYRKLVKKFERRTQEILAAAATSNFIYFSSKTRPLIGILQPSLDQSGRSYPLVIFRVINKSWFLEFPSIIPVVYLNYYQQMQNLNLNTATNLTLPEV